VDFIIQLLRTVFYSLDSIVYSLIPSVYALLIQITRTSIFSQPEIHKFSERIYALIGVFMLFKVTVSVINYILNPDDFSDKEKGFTNIIKRVILSLVMLVLAPYIFQEAFNLQAVILEENTIMNLVFGNPASGETPGKDKNAANGRSSNSSYVDMAGRKIQFTLMYAFAQPNYQEFSGSNFDLMNCENTYAKDEDNNYKFRASSITSNKLSGYIYELEPDCWGVYDSDTDAYVNDGNNGKLMQLFEENDAGTAYQSYAQGVAQQSFSLFFRKEVMTAKAEDGRYFINYRFGISTAVGVATLYMFLMFCIDIAVRSIQWGFLQMISPIPILSYCDPKSGKDGMFKKWFDKCKKVYLDLFIRLFALYFGIYIITLVGTFRDVVTGDEISMMDNWILSIFMILGVLMFVKNLPKFLEETLNLKGGDLFKDYSTPFKRLENNTLGGKAIAGIAKKPVGAVTGLAAGTAAGVAGFATGKGFHLSHLTKGMAGGLKGEKFGKNFASSYGAGKERHKQLQQMEADGVKPSEVRKAQLAAAFGRESKSDIAKRTSARYKLIQDSYKNYEAQAAGADDISKMMKKEIENASARGDSLARDRWQAAFDRRMQEIASTGYKINTGVSATELDALRTSINGGTAYTNASTAGITTGSTSKNEALENYATTMKTLAEKLNNEAVGSVAGASKIATDPTVEIKKIRGMAQGVQNAIDSNEINISNEDISKYAGGGSKK